MTYSRWFFVCSVLSLAVARPLCAQDTLFIHPADLPALKGSGSIAPGTVVRLLPTEPQEPIRPVLGTHPANRDASPCDCWIEPDSTYTRILVTQWDPTGDDGSRGPYALPFTFNLYGTEYSTLYININGNVSFGSPNGVYSASSFPMAGSPMVAPFWADVDLRLSFDDFNRMYFKVTSTAMYFNWVNVGYYDRQIDKLNTFQLIITNGEDPVIGAGYNVSFCYKDMAWTTGSASSGVNGFGGVPATVGANLGDGVNFIQFGRYDHPGNDSDGPFGQADGIDALDGQHFRFSTNTTSGNVAPVLTSYGLCDTVRVCVGADLDLLVGFLAPESDQRISASSATSPTLGPIISTIQDLGPQRTIHLSHVPTAAQVGYHVITLSATDDGSPALTTSLDLVVEVIHTEDVPPTISGSMPTCPADPITLTASPGYLTYQWSNGATTPSVEVTPGTYVVRVTTDACRFASDTVVVQALPAPTATITGVAAVCDGDLATLTLTGQFDSAQWSNGATTPTIEVGIGTYSATVDNDNGCSTTIGSVTVVADSYPTSAAFTMVPEPPIEPRTAIHFNVAEVLPGLSWTWSVNAGDTTATGASFTFDPREPGPYHVALTATTIHGCSATATRSFLVEADDLEIPNVFTPNGDGHNDAFVIGGPWSAADTRLTIYNRWGQTVYESSNYRDTWTAAGQPDGTYYYVIEKADGDRYTGHVTILR